MTSNNALNKSGILQMPAEINGDTGVLLLQTNYSLLLIQFTIAVMTELGRLMRDGGEEENPYSPRSFQYRILN